MEKNDIDLARMAMQHGESGRHASLWNPTVSINLIFVHKKYIVFRKVNFKLGEIQRRVAVERKKKGKMRIYLGVGVGQVGKYTREMHSVQYLWDLKSPQSGHIIPQFHPLLFPHLSAMHHSLLPRFLFLFLFIYIFFYIFKNFFERKLLWV